MKYNRIRPLVMSIVLMGMPYSIKAEAAITQAAQHYHIRAGSLSSVLNQFASSSGINLYYPPDLVAGLKSAGFTGQYAPRAALTRILAGTGIMASSSDGQNFTLKKTPTAAPLTSAAVAAVAVSQSSTAAANNNLTDVVVSANQWNVRDAAGYERVYDNDISIVYAGKELIERFKGAAPADVFKGMVGVNSGDARNSGAIDPNVRGIQGQGRVPVTVDGTEQAITVWRGYNGANNRNYIDPMLIGGMTVEKGPGLTRGVNSSVGGAVTIKTLSVDDVVLPGKDWGVDVQLEGSNNAVHPTLPTLKQGVAVQNDINKPGYNFSVYNDSALMMTPSTHGRNDFGQDYAYRVAAARKWQDFDVLLAYVRRHKGNHYAGTKGADGYRGGAFDAASNANNYWYEFTKYLADVYQAGAEVPNTSSDMQSVLLKSTWRPTDNQAVQLGVRHTWGSYGEIMPSRLADSLSWSHRLSQSELDAYDPSFKDYIAQYVVGKAPQWPLSDIKMTAFNVNHKWNPDNPYINWETNVWTTRTHLDTYTSGGYPREAYPSYAAIPDALKGVLRNTALTNAQNNRWGITSSNQFTLLPQLNLTVGASYQHEKLSSNDRWYEQPSEQAAQAASPWRAYPREGWRKEWDMNFRFDWRPTSWLEITAGARKNGYSSYDEQLARQRAARNSKFAQAGRKGIIADYQIETPEDVNAYDVAWQKNIDDYQNGLIDRAQYRANNRALNQTLFALQDKYKDYEFQNTDSGTLLTRTISWYARDDGRFYREDDPFLNGEVAGDYHGKPLSNGHFERITQAVSGANVFAPVEKQGNSGHWQPVVSATAHITDDAKVYARWARTERNPSIFESTVGFSANPIIDANHVKPERGSTIEVGYVHDLSRLLQADRHADIKVAWFNNTIKDVIDRDAYFTLYNLDKQKTSGLEWQSRYDNGRFFLDFSANYYLNNKVCDESMAVQIDPLHGKVANCVKDGFYNSYLRNMTPPKYSWNLTLGGRFMNERLEVGGRWLHYAGAKNHDRENFGDIQAWVSNVPIYWNAINTFDAWVSYKFKNNLTAEIVATNITDRYYLDPLTRSHFPAPGRTIRIGINKKF